MKRYLLGELSEQERDQVIDRLMTDSDYFDELLIQEDDLIDEYIYGRLSRAEEDRFKNFFLLAPERREKLNMTVALRGQILDARNRNIGEPGKTRKWLKPFFTGSFSWQSAAAVGVIFALALGTLVWFFLENGRLNRELAKERGNQQEQRADLERLNNELAAQRSLTAELSKQNGEQKIRNEQLEQQAALDQLSREKLLNRVARVERERSGLENKLASMRRQLPPLKEQLAVANAHVLWPEVERQMGRQNVVSVGDKEDVVLQMNLEDDKYRQYSAELRDADSRLKWGRSRLRSQETSEGRAVVVRVPAESLKRGSYILRLSGRNDREPYKRISSYQFRVEIK
ncbi:MAG TPA: hypothetical protein VF762_01845 [Blastocatellia bacterium]